MEKTICDKCNREFNPNNHIPRIIIFKKEDKSDLHSFDCYHIFDFCDVCSLFMERMIASGNKIYYKQLGSNKQSYINRMENILETELAKEERKLKFSEEYYR